MHRSRAPWRDILRDFMTAVAHTDYTWRRPARRFVGSGIYLPSLHSDGLGPIVLATDTSLSMDAGTLGQVWSEVRQIAGDMRPERITVIECDHAIQTVTDHTPGDIPAEYLAHGSGGTSTRPVFEWVEAHHDSAPAALIYYADLYVSEGDFAAGGPGYPVLWAAYGAPPVQLTPPWGMRLDIGD